jgi:hypothetical protein
MFDSRAAGPRRSTGREPLQRLEALCGGLRSVEETSLVAPGLGSQRVVGDRAVQGTPTSEPRRKPRPGPDPPGPDLGGTDRKTTSSWPSSRPSDCADLTSAIIAPDNDDTRNIGITERRHQIDRPILLRGAWRC